MKQVQVWNQKKYTMLFAHQRERRSKLGYSSLLLDQYSDIFQKSNIDSGIIKIIREQIAGVPAIGEMPKWPTIMISIKWVTIRLTGFKSTP